MLYAKVFDIQQPVVIFFNKLDEIEQVVIAANNPYTGTQIVNIGITLINNLNNFKKSLIFSTDQRYSECFRRNKTRMNGYFK